MPARRLGMFLVICAPSGAGKSTLIKKLCAEFPAISFSVSATTRAPRQGERPGLDYHFLSREEFLAWREAGKLADFCIVEKNPLKIELDEVRNLRVLETVKEGETVWTRK